MCILTEFTLLRNVLNNFENMLNVNNNRIINS